MEQVASLDALVGKKLGLYRLEKLLGYGGMAAVYQSVHEALARTVAVKVLLPSLVLGPPRISFLDRFRDEARLVATLNHPNILPVYDFGINPDGIAYLVMHYAPGGSLQDRLNPTKRGGPLTLKETCHYLSQVAAALDYAHKRGIVHRDVKPHNLLLEDHHLMLGDFGIARLIAASADEDGEDSAATLTGGVAIRGTPLYIAPEQGRGEPVDWRADIYALGVTVYQMLSGHVPFNDPAGAWSIIMKHVCDPPPPLAGQHGVTKEVEAVVMKALAKLPEDRYQSAGAFAAAFLAAVAGQPGRPAASPAGAKPNQGPAGKEAGHLAGGRKCPRCGTINRPDAKFCLKDGTRLLTTVRQWDDEEELVRICPTCGFLNRPSAKI
jgi:serine/threonine protein kinase